MPSDTPDWTYDEPIKAFVVDRTALSMEHERRFLARGLIARFRVSLLREEISAVEQRAMGLHTETLGMGPGLFSEEPVGYRFWYVDEDGLEETDRQQYEATLAEFREDRRLQVGWGLRLFSFRFEEEYRPSLPISGARVREEMSFEPP